MSENCQSQVVAKLLERLDPVDEPVDDGHEDDVGRLPPTEPGRVVFLEELVENLPSEVLGPGVRLPVDVGEEPLTEYWVVILLLLSADHGGLPLEDLLAPRISCLLLTLKAVISSVAAGNPR